MPTFSFKARSSDSYIFSLVSMVTTLASDSCLAVSADSSFELISTIDPSLSSTLDFSDRVSGKGSTIHCRKEISLYQKYPLLKPHKFYRLPDRWTDREKDRQNQYVSLANEKKKKCVSLSC